MRQTEYDRCPICGSYDIDEPSIDDDGFCWDCGETFTIEDQEYAG